MSDAEFDTLFTAGGRHFATTAIVADPPPDVPARNHDTSRPRYKEEGTTTTPFDMVMLNDLDRFHLVMA